jgi:hypothetical protein
MSGASRHPAAVAIVRQMAMVAVPIATYVLLPPVGRFSDRPVKE